MPPEEVKNVRKTFIFFFLALVGTCTLARPSFAYDYHLYQNFEKFGILVFPKKNIFKGLDDYIRSIGFESVHSGKAVMRYGPKRSNQTYMMPPTVQKKFAMNRFIILQVLEDQNLLVAVFDPNWELTLPSAIFPLGEVKKNIPRTLNVFRGSNPQSEISFYPPPTANKYGKGPANRTRY